MLYLYATDIHGVAQQYDFKLFLVLSDSTSDSSTTRCPIPILFPRHCSLGFYLHNGIRYIPVHWIFIELIPLVHLDSMLDSSTTRCPISILSMGHCSPSS